MRQINNLIELEKVISNKQNIVIYVYANWCIDCKLYELNINQSFVSIDSEKIFSLNIDNFNMFCSEYKISKLPTIAVFNDYKLINKIGDGSSIPHGLVNEFLKKYF